MPLEDHKNIGIIGAGGQVSLGVLNQAAEKADITRERIMLLVDSQKFLLKPDGIPTDTIREILEPGYADNEAKASSRANVKDYMRTEGAESYQDLAGLLENIHADVLRPRLLDVSGMSGEAAFEAHRMSQELGMVLSTANKNPGAYSELAAYQDMLGYPQGRYSDEVACMAGSGVLGYVEGRTLAGDQVESIEGSYSGTLTFIFSTLEDEVRRALDNGGTFKPKTFSQIVAEAQEAGFTEPHPADDLNLKDMAKKMELHNKKLGREVGVNNTIIKGFIPEEINAIEDVEAYLEALQQVDQAIYEQMAAAINDSKTLRVVGIIDKAGNTSVELKELGLGHPVAQLKKALNGTQVVSKDRGPWKLIAPGAGINKTATSVREHVLKLTPSTTNPRNQRRFPVDVADGC